MCSKVRLKDRPNMSLDVYRGRKTTIQQQPLCWFCHVDIQSTLVISTSVISNNRLSQRENLILVLTHKSNIRYQNSVGKRRNCSSGTIYPLFHNIFNIYFLLNESNYMFICEIWLFHWYFPQFCKSDLSKYGFLEVFQRFPLTSR